jgi:PP-loop superfamily ATP-utilizing enzyme
VSDCVCVCACVCVYNRNSITLQHAPIIVIVKERLDENYGEKNDEKCYICKGARACIKQMLLCMWTRGLRDVIDLGCGHENMEMLTGGYTL